MNADSYYNLLPPPRVVPWPIQGQVLFGGFFNQLGWLWLGFSLIFVWIFGLNADISPLFFALAQVDTAQGNILTVETTSASENETPVYANHYRFRVERLEQEFSGTSYTTGQQYSPNQPVTVEYLVDNPTRSRIQGARGGTFSGWVLCLVGLFPAVGLTFIGVGLRQGIRGNRLLRHGQVGLGRLIAKAPTNTSINDQTVYKLTFEFTAGDGQQYTAIAKSHRTRVLEDEAEEQLVYDPRNPANAVLLDSLPGEPDIDELGQIQVAHFRRSLLSLILPALVISIHSTLFLVTIASL